MKKELVKVTIAVHPFQAAMIRGLQAGKIDLGKDSLREIAKKCGKESAQETQHHMDALKKLGIINYIHGQYVYQKEK